MVDLDLNAPRAYGLTPTDVTNAIVAQNPIEPLGLAKIGNQQYPIRLNATLTLQATNLQRANTLTRQGFETVQNQQTQATTVASQQAALDTAKAGVGLAEANVKAQQATVDRLKSLTAFENVMAPFDGVVTARNVEVGDLVNADVGTGAPMFTVEEEDFLRVAIEVPQYASQGVRDGVEAKTTVPEMPGRTFPGNVARTTVALLYSSRTMSAEVDVPNPDGALRPGLYVNVSLAIPRTTPIVNVPADALIFNQKAMQVAVVHQTRRSRCARSKSLAILERRWTSNPDSTKARSSS